VVAAPSPQWVLHCPDWVLALVLCLQAWRG
jgi:hypothetical protein